MNSKSAKLNSNAANGTSSRRPSKTRDNKDERPRKIAERNGIGAMSKADAATLKAWKLTYENRKEFVK